MLYHPILIHYPIAFYFLELILLIFSKKDPSFRNFALYVFRLAYLFAIAAMVSGVIDAGGPKNFFKGWVPYHLFSALTLFLVSTGRAFYWRYGDKDGAGFVKVLIATSILANLLVAATGFFGGELVYG